MKIHFEVRDSKCKLITEGYRELIELSEMYWSNKFSRTQLSVFFIEENEFSKCKPHPALQYNNADNDVNDKNPETEIMGMYFPFHHEYGPDVVVICPQRIDDISKKYGLLFRNLLNKVFTHELAHSLMTKDVFSLSEADLYQIPSFKFFEESLCNAFALLHFNDKEGELLKTFCRSQPSGYCDFHMWGDSFVNIISSMDNHKNLKGDCHYWINDCWFKKGYDFLSGSKVKVNEVLLEQKTACFNYDIKDAGKLKYKLSHDHKNINTLFFNLFKLKCGVMDGSVFSDDTRKFADEVYRKIGEPIIKETQYLVTKVKDCDYYICLDINGISVFPMEKNILKNIENENFNIISLIDV